MLTTICPYCEAVSEHQTPVGHEADSPANGDASVCAGCGETAVFDFAEPANVRKPDDGEQARIISHPDFPKALQIVSEGACDE